MARCTAKAKRTGLQCTQPAITGSTKCRLHGGKTPKGIASPHYRTGKYAKDLPKALTSDYDQALNDDRLVDLKDELAIVEALVAERLRLMSGTTSAEKWIEATELWAEIREAARSGDAQAIPELSAQMDKLLETGASVQGHEQSVLKLFDQKSKLVSTYARQQQAAGMMVSATSVQFMVGQILTLIQTHVKDVEALKALRAGFADLRFAESAIGDRPPN